MAIKKAVGMIEFKSIAKGIEATDTMMKAANVKLIMSSSLCPGKYMSLIVGDVGAVKNAIETGKITGGLFTIEDYVIPNLSEDVFPALTATLDVDKISSIGIIETMTAVASIVAGDIAVKAANVQLLEIRIARGLGGKGFTIITGDIGAVKAAIKSCENELKELGGLISAVAISSPSKELISEIV